MHGTTSSIAPSASSRPPVAGRVQKAPLPPANAVVAVTPWPAPIIAPVVLSVVSLVALVLAPGARIEDALVGIDQHRALVSVPECELLSVGDSALSLS